MALEGNLKSFGLAEILQLIAVQQKTGMLTVTRDTQSVVMFFREGQIVSTRDRRRKARDPFREYVARYGVLTRADLDRVAQIAQQSKLDFVDIVASEGFLSEDELRMHWRKQVQETMHEVLTWEQCTYKFITSEEVVATVKTLGVFSVEAMLMESMRRIDEFPGLLEMFPNDGILVARTGDPDPSAELTTNERMILDLLGGDIVSIRDLIARGRMPLFEVYETLKLLREKKLIRTRDERAEAAAEAEAREASSGSRRRRRNPLPFLVALAALGAASWTTLRAPATRAVRLVSRSAATRTVPAPRADGSIAFDRERVAEHVRWLVEAYRAQTGAWPRSLDDLGRAGLAAPRTLRTARTLGIRYRLTPDGGGYTLI